MVDLIMASVQAVAVPGRVGVGGSGDLGAGEALAGWGRAYRGAIRDGWRMEGGACTVGGRGSE
jgi:hypothetical protein